MIHWPSFRKAARDVVIWTLCTLAVIGVVMGALHAVHDYPMPSFYTVCAFLFVCCFVLRYNDHRYDKRSNK